jgi:predicted nuclease of predicted toxin-antitoxin system
MRFLLDENVSGTVIRDLRKAEHDVASVKENMQGAKDEDLIAKARSENRILVTHDKDFGELAFKLGLSAMSGVVLIRLSGADPREDNSRIVKILSSHTDFTGNFTVITDDKIRVRPLPPPDPTQ